jgi:hypothetical protein
MDISVAIQFGQLVNAAYAAPPEDLTNRVGEEVDVGPSSGTAAYKVISTIYGNDLSTDMNPSRGQNRSRLDSFSKRRTPGMSSSPSVEQKASWSGSRMPSF